jgi:hypothetical protein
MQPLDNVPLSVPRLEYASVVFSALMGEFLHNSLTGFLVGRGPRFLDLLCTHMEIKKRPFGKRESE